MSTKGSCGRSTEAVVLGGSLNALGVVRSLARAGIRVTVVGQRSTDAALWSRYASARIFRQFSGRTFTEALIKLGKSFSEPPILYLTQEDCVHSVSENRFELANWFHFRLPHDDCINTMSNKASFHEFALTHGFPVPHSLILETENDAEALDQLTFPCILKPSDKQDVQSGRVDRIIKASSLDKARRRAKSLLRNGVRLVAQEWVEGEDSNIYFTLFYRGGDGRMVSMFTGRKLLSFPRHVGSTAICIGADEARDALDAMTVAFAERAGLYGMGSMEYKWDDNHRKFVMIEPTVGRTDWQEEIATLCGINIPAAAYRHELGLASIHESVQGSNIAWRATVADRVPRHLRNEGTELIDGYFRWDDPLPGLQHYCMINPVRLAWRQLRLRKIVRAMPGILPGASRQ